MRTSCLSCAALLVLSACSGTSTPPPDGSPPPGTDAGRPPPGTDGGSVPPVIEDIVAPPEATPAERLPIPATLPAAPELPADADIRYVANRGSVRVYLPAVESAGDYRIYALEDGVSVSMDGEGQRVEGATISCAGLRQSSHCDDAEAVDFGTPFDAEPCSEDGRAHSVPRRLVTNVQVDGLSGPSTLVIEAIDALCPFPGAYGAEHGEVECVNGGERIGSARYDGQVVQWAMCPATIPIRTEAEIRAQYGSMILNGHGPAPAPTLGTSPEQSFYANVGLPAPARSPRVIGRAVIRVTPGSTTELPPGFTASDFFEGFDDPSDQPQPVEGRRLVPRDFGVYSEALYSTSQLDLLSFATEPEAHFFVAQGTLRSVMPDGGGEVMGSHVMYPRRAFQLPATDERFLHVTFEAPTDATARRYFWVAACGAPEPGQTIVGGHLAEEAGLVPQPGFMDPEVGANVSRIGWNCIHLVPRDGGYEHIDGGPEGEPARAQTDVRVIIDRAGAVDGAVVNVSPPQNQFEAPSWFREWNDAHELVGSMIDGEMYVEQRTRFDLFLNRGRLVVFVNGRQKICNDFPNERLTMAEAAIGVGHVLYHTSAERSDQVRQDWIHSAQYYYRYNTPTLDQRSFDDFGVREGAGLPASFSEAQCFSAD